MVLLARETRGRTQTELAKLVGFSQARLSKIEDGVIPATANDIAALGEKLSYPPSLFYRRDVRPGAFNGLYRRRKSLGTRFLSQFNACVVLRTDRIHRLTRKDAIVKSDFPFCDPDDYTGGAEQIAACVRQYLGIPPGPVRSLIELLEDHGIVIIQQDFGSSKIDGVSIFTKDGRPVIFLNSAQPRSRQVFTTIHEMAHMAMHRLPRPEEAMEEESDKFTAEFAMPADDIRPHFQSIGYVTIEKLGKLKLHWNVSMAALLRRARDLGFVDARRYTSLNVMMSAKGYRRNEPFEEYIKLGEPTFERELIEYHVRDLRYSEKQMCELLDMVPAEYRSTYVSETGGLRIVE